MVQIWYSVLLVVMGFAGGVVYMIYRCGYLLDKRQKLLEKKEVYFDVLDRWLLYKEQKDSWADYFKDKHIESAAIYGMANVGKHVKYELEKAGVRVAYVMDQSEKVLYGTEDHYSLNDELPMTDLVIVTALMDFEKIKKEIQQKNPMLKVISVDEMLNEN